MAKSPAQRNGLLEGKPISQRVHKALMKVNAANMMTAADAGKLFAQQTFLAVVDLEAQLDELKGKLNADN